MIVKPDFIVGSEQRFFDFVKNLTGDDRVAIISHSDLDGVASVKVANEVLQADLIKFIDYEEIDGKLANDLRKSKITKIVILDVNVTNKEFISQLERFARILIIDHHTINEDFNSNRTIFLNAQGFCASYLAYYLFSKISDLSAIDWLVACASISDFLYFKNEAWLREVFLKYKDSYRLSAGILDKRTKFWDLQARISSALIYFKGRAREVYDRIGRGYGSIGDLGSYAKIVDDEIEKWTDDFPSLKEVVGGRYYYQIDSRFGVKESVVNHLCINEPSKTFIVTQKFNDKVFVSARRQDGKENLPEYLKKLLNGFENSGSGGHLKAAGAFFPLKYLEIFERRLKNA